MKKVLDVLVYILIVLILFILVSVLISTLKSKTKEPNIFGHKMFIIVSGSMNPAIKVGDIVITKPAENIKSGDIITFQTLGNTLVTHRVTEILEENGETKYKTKGDSNNIEDKKLVSKENIKGTYVFKVFGAGYILMFLQKYIVLIVAGIAVILLIRYFIKIIKGDTNEKV